MGWRTDGQLKAEAINEDAHKLIQQKADFSQTQKLESFESLTLIG
jgi:hypothetical protein